MLVVAFRFEIQLGLIPYLQDSVINSNSCRKKKFPSDETSNCSATRIYNVCTTKFNVIVHDFKQYKLCKSFTYVQLKIKNLNYKVTIKTNSNL